MWRLSQGNRLVAEALATTVERDAHGGRPWCPPHAADALLTLLTRRDQGLGATLQRVVRFVRLLVLIGDKDYLTPLYVDAIKGTGCPCLSTQYFKQVFTRALAQDNVPVGAFEVSTHGLRLLEPEMAGVSAGALCPFDLDYAAMPLMAGLLDVLQNALGFIETARILAPVLQRGGIARPAAEVGRDLTAVFEAWLTANLDTTHRLRQARAMMAFLMRRGAGGRAAIDDDAILDFWQTQSQLPAEHRIDGFTLFKTTAQSMVMLRLALSDASAARALSLAEPLDLTLAATNHGGSPMHNDTADWHSPLIELSRSPAATVKWLTKAEKDALTNYLGAGVGDDDSEAENVASAALQRPSRLRPSAGLACGARFDLNLWRTLMRVDVFGTAQAVLVQQLRLNANPNNAVMTALRHVSPTAYDDALTVYATIHKQVRREALAALHILALHGRAEAVLLLSALGVPEAVAELRTELVHRRVSPLLYGQDGSADTDDTDIQSQAVDAIGHALQRIAHDPKSATGSALRGLFVTAATAFKDVNRVGFRDGGATTPEAIAGLAVAAEPIVRLLGELDRLLVALSRPGRPGSAEPDHVTFKRIFRVLCQARETETT
jgi:hypothetical protein